MGVDLMFNPPESDYTGMKKYKCTNENGYEKIIEHFDPEGAAEEFAKYLCGEDSDYYSYAEKYGIEVYVNGKSYTVYGEPSMYFNATKGKRDD